MKILAADRPVAQPVIATNRLPLPEWPHGWYAVMLARELLPGKTAVARIAGSEIVLFRSSSGLLGALDAHCPHMGAHLQHGRVRGEELECALHCWKIGRDGTIAGRRERAVAWRVQERFGLVMLAVGEEIPPPMVGDADFVWTQAPPLDVPANWHGLVCNAFDMEHLCTVHQRELVAPVQVSVEPGRYFSLQYISRVRGRELSDRIMKWLTGDRIRVTVRCTGAITTVETDLGFTRTAACLGMLPTETGTRVVAAFGIRHGRFNRLRMWMTRWLFSAFLRRDICVIEGMQLRTDVDDPTLQSLFDFLRAFRSGKR